MLMLTNGGAIQMMRSTWLPWPPQPQCVVVVGEEEAEGRRGSPTAGGAVGPLPASLRAGALTMRCCMTRRQAALRWLWAVVRRAAQPQGCPR